MIEEKIHETETLDLKFFGDKKLMAEIEGKVSSNDKEEIIESLNLFEKNWKNLPSEPASDFIHNIMESENAEIKEKAEKVYENYLKEHDDLLNKEIRQISNNFSSIILPIQSQMKGLATAFQTAKQMADIANNLRLPPISFPDLSSNFTELAELNKVLIETKHIIDTNKLATPLLLQPSPILRAENLFSKITDEKLELNYKEIDEDINFISEQNKDFCFNFPSYELLFYLESYLRYLIKKIIIEPNEANLQNKIPANIIDKWEKRKEDEENNSLVDGGYELIYYSDFTDIKEIFQKGRNLELFNDIFNPEQFKSIIGKLHELDPIRKKIAHYRPISETEFNRLRLYSNDILQKQENSRILFNSSSM